MQNRFDADFELIPHVELSDDQKNECVKIMRRGNTVLHTYHARVKVKLGLLQYSRRRFRQKFFEAVKAAPNKVVVDGVGIPQTDVALILSVKKIESTMLSSVGKMILQQAYKWNKMNSECGMMLEDFYNEAVMGVLEAIYGFHKAGIVFSTYCQWCIHRRLMHVTNESKPLSSWSDKGRKLYGKFLKAKKKMDIKASFDEIVKRMKLNETEISVLKSMNANVVNSSMLSRGRDEDEHSSVYEKLLVSDHKASSSNAILKIDHKDMLESVEMTDWEKAVLNAYLHGGVGWATQVAKEHNYSRRAPALALKRVIDRIQEKYVVEPLSDAA